MENEEFSKVNFADFLEIFKVLEVRRKPDVNFVVFTSLKLQFSSSLLRRRDCAQAEKNL